MAAPLPVDPARYLSFLGVMAVVAATPGPANLFAIATGARRGKAAALAAVAGMNCATIVWFAAAALGLGAVAAAWPGAFRLLAYGGALYVAWLGLKALASASMGRPGGVAQPGPEHPEIAPPAGRSAIRGGFIVQIANPKIILFFTAVLPPFIDPGRPLPVQLAAFACATLTLDILFMSAHGLGGAALAERMTRPRFARGFSIFTGVLLLAAAALIGARA